MNALDVISLDSAKKWLQIHEGDDYDDVHIQRLIKTAVNWVEQYTSYRLYQRLETITAIAYDTYLAQYPIEISAVTADYTVTNEPTKVKISAPIGTSITLLVGYDDVTDIPSPLVDGCYKLITYLYQNRDAYSYPMPTDIQMLINQYRRAII